MPSTKSAVQRVLDVPEILLLIFLELDNPGNFGRVNRRFRETSTDYFNIARHFEQRYYPFEIMSELLMRVSVHKERLDLIAVRLALNCMMGVEHALRACGSALLDPWWSAFPVLLSGSTAVSITCRRTRSQPESEIQSQPVRHQLAKRSTEAFVADWALARRRQDHNNRLQNV